MTSKNDKKRKLSFRKRIFLFKALDIKSQLSVLLKIFVPIIVGCGIIQYCMQIFGYKIALLPTVLYILVLIVLPLCMPPEKEEIISNRDSSLRIIKMCLNIVLGFIYMMIFGIIATKGFLLIKKFVPVYNSDEILCFIFIWYLVWCILFVWLIIFKYNKKLFYNLVSGKIIRSHLFCVEHDEFVLINLKHRRLHCCLANSKTKRIELGDILIFDDIDAEEKQIVAEVKNLYFAEDFSKLLPKINLRQVGIYDEADYLKLLKQCYSTKKQNGVVAIEFAILYQ